MCVWLCDLDKYMCYVCMTMWFRLLFLYFGRLHLIWIWLCGIFLNQKTKKTSSYLKIAVSAAPKAKAPHYTVQRLGLRRCTPGHGSPESNRIIPESTRSVPVGFAPQKLLSQCASPLSSSLPLSNPSQIRSIWPWISNPTPPLRHGFIRFHDEATVC